MKKWRLILDGKNPGGLNMAVDESVLSLYGSRSTQRPTLRLYGWREPTLSIGYLQKASGINHCGLPLVRRITGGRAVLHDMELTYSIVADPDSPAFSGGISAAYSIISRCIIKALKDSGVPADFSSTRRRGSRSEKDACFYSPARYEVTVNGRKLVGSSQRRFKGAFLQHGSIIFDIDEKLNAEIFGPALLNRISRVREFSEVTVAGFTDRLIKAFAEGLGADFSIEGLIAEESSLTDTLLETRYSREQWNLEGAHTSHDQARKGV